MNTRPYRMTARADQAGHTGDRIVDAMLERFSALPYVHIRLEDVAADAGVTVQTVLRRFGSKAGLLRTVIERELVTIVDNRAAIAGAPAQETVEALADHYETYGALILKMYAEASLAEGVDQLAARGRAYHLAWCRTAFAADLEHCPDATRRQRRLAQVVAVCDARTWHILRVDQGLSAEETKRALVEMLTPLLAGSGT